MPHRYPETHVLYRNLARAYPLIIKGEGCWLYDSEGRNYLDACGGAFVACLGHGVAEVVEAMAEQVRRVGYVSGMAFTNEAAETLADELAGLALEGIASTFLDPVDRASLEGEFADQIAAIPNRP